MILQSMDTADLFPGYNDGLTTAGRMALDEQLRKAETRQRSNNCLQVTKTTNGWTCTTGTVTHVTKDNKVWKSYPIYSMQFSSNDITTKTQGFDANEYPIDESFEKKLVETFIHDNKDFLSLALPEETVLRFKRLQFCPSYVKDGYATLDLHNATKPHVQHIVENYEDGISEQALLHKTRDLISKLNNS